MTLRRLADDVRLEVEYEDDTPFGSAIGGRADAAIRRDCPAICQPSAASDIERVVRSSKELLTDAFANGLASRFVRSSVLREDCLFPPSERVRPSRVVVTRDNRAVAALEIGRDAFRELASWIAEFERGSERPSSEVGGALFDALEGAGALSVEPEERQPIPESDLLLVGHATASIGRILIDPFLLPPSPRYPETYQPLRIADLGPIEAVFVTHSHPDHFDIATLLRVGADVPIYVPEVERESLLAIDMAARLAELGFSKVERVRPGADVTLGETRVRVLPFFGEQPTTSECLHPDVRNVGCTYFFESRDRRTLAIADSGRDREGDVLDLAARVRREWGDVDVLLGGYRGFALYPIQYIFSSVARYLLFVPPSEWGVRQLCMNDSDAMLDTAERCGARYAVPYADGGAPWYWEIGLGPRLDGHGTPNPAIDPPPEEVAHCAAARSSAGSVAIESPVRVVILRPGEGLRLGDDGGAEVDHGPRAIWPYSAHEWHQVNVVLKPSGGSALVSARAMFRALEPLLAAWRSAGRLTQFFFMRKPPDVRLRFLGDPSLEREIAELMQGLRRDGFVERTFPSVYEPETTRFGGARAMDAAHAWFDVDSAAWMRLDRLESAGQAAFRADVLVCAVANDLVSRTIADRSEVWAVWRAYAASLGLEQDDQAPRLLAIDIEALAAAVEPAVAEVIESYRAANRVLASELNALWSRGELEAGLRSVLGALILFHLHRYGFDAAGHARVAWTMIRALEPKS